MLKDELIHLLVIVGPLTAMAVGLYYWIVPRRPKADVIHFRNIKNSQHCETSKNNDV